MNVDLKNKIFGFKKRNEEEFSDLNELIKYLNMADMKDLAKRLYELRYTFNDTSSRKIDLQSQVDDDVVDTITTKKEYVRIKSGAITLNKKTTLMVKQYRELYNLYLHANDIVLDMKICGILGNEGKNLKNAVTKYFTQSKGYYDHYYHRAAGTYYITKSREHLGYKYLEFYRDDNNKYYNETQKHKR